MTKRGFQGGSNGSFHEGSVTEADALTLLIAEQFKRHFGRENGTAKVQQDQHTIWSIYRLDSFENFIGGSAQDIIDSSTGRCNWGFALRHLPGEFYNACCQLGAMRNNH